MIYRRSADTGILPSVNVSAVLGLVSGIASITWFHYLVGALDRLRSAHSIQFKPCIVTLAELCLRRSL